MKTVLVVLFGMTVGMIGAIAITAIFTHDQPSEYQLKTLDMNFGTPPLIGR